MKRFTLILSFVVLVALPSFAGRVTPEMAKKVASTFLNNQGAKAPQLVDLSQKAGFSNLYIFNAEQGFVVMAADDCVKPILGYSTTGTFVTENMPDNIRYWLQGYNNEIQYAIDQNLNASAETAQQWKALVEGQKAAKATPVIGPLVQTTWNQDDPYNLYCPSGTVTGCVATAMAQVMKYWNYPAHGMGSHAYVPESNPSLGEQFADFNATNYDWTNMKNSYAGSSTTAQKQAVATLMYHCGVSVDMDYGPSSGAPTSNVAYTLKSYFNYSDELQFIERTSLMTDAEWINLLKNDLDQSRPIQYSGSGSGGGHSFVCDGYDTDGYFHFNWGWGGYCDAYYNINNLNPGPGGIGSGSNGIYNDEQGAIFGVRPSDCTLDAPELSFTLNERNVTLNWTATSGAVKYNIYRNSNYIGNSTSTSFSDIAPFGNTQYYVRAEDSSGEMSLSSNAIITTVDYQTPAVNNLEATFSSSNASLTWTAPEWCFPETESSILTYGSGITGGHVGYQGAQNMYWGHRYSTSDLAGAYGKAIFRVSFYVNEPGVYKLFIYKGTASSTISGYTSDHPVTQMKNKTITATQIGWFTIDLDEPVNIDTNQDLWIVMYDPESKNMPAEYCSFSSHDRGGYYSTNITNYTYNLSEFTDGAFLIRTYLTDGIYTYNLYRDGVKVANNISTTSYSTSIFDNKPNQLVVKTNYYGGEAPSNMVGYAKGTSTIASLELGDNDMMTLAENATLTVTGNASNNTVEHLVLENGAQFIHNSADVKATVKKNIEGYSGEDGWYFIASPIAENTTPSEENGFLNGSIGSNSYDLYYYDEPTYYWMNYETSAFDIEPKTGYLYAKGEGGTTLTFAGTLTASNSAVASNTLSYTSDVLKGFNLVGNPFVCNAGIDKDFYIIDNTTHRVILAPEETPIAPCEGVFVQASADGQTATFSKGTSKNGNTNTSMDLVISQDKYTLDRARVRFGEGETLEKFSLDNKSSQLSFPQNGHDYAVICSNQSSEIPVNFKAAAGTYTISVSDDLSSQLSALSYLHLIDNLTGADIDLLTTPCYTFEVNDTDYASRFKLVFAPISDIEDSEWFAYYADGRIVVPNMNSDETLQIIDVTGRMVQNRNLSNGVYVLRLVSDNGVKTQKIVIK